jgi:two-component system sensor histidine kinase DesK
VLDLAGRGTGTGRLALGLALALVLVGLHLALLAWRPPRRWGALAVVAQTVLTLAPITVFGPSWIAMPSLSFGGALLMAGPRVAFGCVLPVAAIVQLLTGAGVAQVVLGCVLTAALGALAGLPALAPPPPADEVRTALAVERRRFARDLHDLLGSGLAAIGVKSELAHRLALADPDAARAELADIMEITRRTLADVRAVAHGQLRVSLEDEAQSARSTLAAAEVETKIVLDYQDLPPDASTVLAAALREGLVNVLRHSKAKRCEITVRRTGGSVYLDMINNGAATESCDDTGGVGVLNLTGRVRAAGGEVSACTTAGGWYRLHVRLPVC